MKQNQKRFKEILNVLKEEDFIHGISPDKLSNALTKLGPTFIKIGQILSLRVDLLSQEYIEKLSKLRSNVAPLTYDQINDILKNEYDDIDKVFKIIDEKPLGSASIAQVHKAKLVNGNNVVIKIKRPNVSEIMLEDISLLRKAINTLQLNKFIKIIDLNEVLNQIEKTTKEETDFKNEINNLKKFYLNNINIENISCPKVYEDICTDNCIVMEDVVGLKINDIKWLKNADYDLSLIDNTLCQNYMKQALDDGFFHADPHSDNILISNDKIVFIDLGMMGTLNNHNKILLNNCIKAIIMDNYRSVSDCLINMCKSNTDVNYNKLTKDITNILEEYKNASLENIKLIDFVNAMFKMLNDNGLELDNDITMLIRGILVIEGVINALDSSISLYSVLIDRFISKSLSKKNIIDKFEDGTKKVIESTDSLITLPKEINNLVNDLNNGRVKFKFEMASSTKQVDKLESLIHELVLGFIDGCLIIAASLINDKPLKLTFMLFIIILSSILIVKIIIDHNHHGY